MDFNDPLTADFPQRTFAEEEEAEAQEVAQCYTVLPVYTWQPGSEPTTDGPLKPRLLVVADSNAACTLLQHCCPNKQVAGTVVTPAGPSGEIAVSPAALEHTAVILSAPATDAAPPAAVDQQETLVVVMQRPLAAERTVAWVRALYSRMQPQHTVVLSGMAANEYRGPGDPAQEVLLFTMETTAAKQQRKGQPGLVSLPSGSLVSGLPAAIISHCQARSMAASLLVGVQMAPTPDRLHMHGLASAAKTLTASLLGGPAPGLAFSDANAVNEACKALEKTYRSTAVASMFT